MQISDDGQRFGFDKRELAVLTAMMAGEDRKSLAALWLHPSKAQAWATDGHRAVMVERDIKPPKVPKNAKPVAIPAATAHHAAKTARPRDVVVIDISGTRVAIDVRERTARGITFENFDQIDAQTRSKHAVACARHAGGHGSIENFFPAHHTRGSKGAVLPVDPSLLAPLCQLGKITNQVWISVGKPREPVTFVGKADEWTVWRMLVMPRFAESDVHPDHGRAPNKPARSKRRRAKKEPAATPEMAPAAEVSTGDPKLRAVS